MKKFILPVSFAVACLLPFSSCDVANSALNTANAALGGSTGQPTPLSNLDISNGLKQALEQGVSNGTARLSSVDGFFKDAAVKILMPPEAQQVAQKLTDIGMGSLVDKAVEKMNRAAEDASKSAGPIFVNAIRNMSFDDARNILMGQPNSATNFLRNATTNPLYTAFQPTIKNSLNAVGAVDAWKLVFDNYNKIPFITKVNVNLDDYVTKKAITGVFHMVEKEEANIRQNPVARATDLLQRVFKLQDNR